MKFTRTFAIQAPEVRYALIVDMGENGTKTIYSDDREQDVKSMLDRFHNGEYEGLDLYADEIPNITGISMVQSIEVPSDYVSIITDGNTKQVITEIFSAEVV